MPDGLQSKRAPRHSSAFRAYSTKSRKLSAVLSQRMAFASYMHARGYLVSREGAYVASARSMISRRHLRSRNLLHAIDCRGRTCC